MPETPVVDPNLAAIADLTKQVADQKLLIEASQRDIEEVRRQLAGTLVILEGGDIPPGDFKIVEDNATVKAAIAMRAELKTAQGLFQTSEANGAAKQTAIDALVTERDALHSLNVELQAKLNTAAKEFEDLAVATTPPPAIEQPKAVITRSSWKPTPLTPQTIVGNGLAAKLQAGGEVTLTPAETQAMFDCVTTLGSYTLAYDKLSILYFDVINDHSIARNRLADTAEEFAKVRVGTFEYDFTAAQQARADLTLAIRRAEDVTSIVGAVIKLGTAFWK